MGTIFKTYSAILIFALCGLLLGNKCYCQKNGSGIRGKPEAVADAKAMVETMGGITLWAQLKSVHFVTEWYPCDRVDSYIENEILDLTGPRSWADRKSEINHILRVYSPEGKHWSIVNGKFSYASDDVLKEDMIRAPFNFYHLVKAIASGDPFYEVRFGTGDIPHTRRLEFYGPDGVMNGWVILNARKEPIVKGTAQYRYTLGPLKKFGNLYFPVWGVYDNGYTRYNLISATGDNKDPDMSLFIPPAEYMEN
ncbi:MAG: hypothetical protein GC171_06190 [Terrimonas sp.]|nr:hypothetical protein [Terrimonas sp.]